MSKLELLYQPVEEKVKDAKSVDEFYDIIQPEDVRDKFLTAVRDTKFIGFKAGFAAAMSLFSEIAG